MGVGVLVWVDGWCLDRSMRVQLYVRDVCVCMVCMALGAAVLMQSFESCGGR